MKPMNPNKCPGCDICLTPNKFKSDMRFNHSDRNRLWFKLWCRGCGYIFINRRVLPFWHYEDSPSLQVPASGSGAMGTTKPSVILKMTKRKKDG